MNAAAKALAATVLGLLALVVGPSAAQASSSQTVYFEAPRDLTAAWTTIKGRKDALDKIESLGATALRVNLRWYDVAPGRDDENKPAFNAADPKAYNWGAYGQVIDDAKSRGWRLLVSPSSNVPRWATEAKADTLTRPDPDEFKLFTKAAAKRFGGSSKVMWSIWNEPNLENFLRPQVVGGKFVAGKLYRKLFIAGRSGIKSVDKKARVLFGETAPSGVARKRQKPLAFLRDALCVTSKYKRKKGCRKLSVDGFAHHPYRSIRGIPRSKDDVTYQVLSRYTRAIDKIAKAKAIPRGRKLYLTEFGIQSLPDKLFGVSLQRQLEERARAERVAYGNRRVRGFSQYLLTDDNPTEPGKLWGGFETGLIDWEGNEKPSLEGFRLVLDAKPTKKQISLWGLVRPADGKTKVVIERRTGKTWSKWKTVKTKSNGSFKATDKKRTKVSYRYVWDDPKLGELTSPGVRPFKG